MRRSRCWCLLLLGPAFLGPLRPPRAPQLARPAQPGDARPNLAAPAAAAALLLLASAATAAPQLEVAAAQRLPDWTSLLKPEWRAALRADEKAAWRRVPKSVLKRLRGVAADLADLQQDVYDQDWQNLEIYPNLFQAYLPAAGPAKRCKAHHFSSFSLVLAHVQLANGFDFASKRLQTH